MKYSLRKLTALVIALTMVLSVFCAYTASAASTGDPDDTAEIITLNFPSEGSLANEDAERFYRFKLRESSKVSFSFGHENLGDDDGFWAIELTNIEGQTLLSFSSAGTDTITESCNIGLPKGDYYITVSSDTSFSSAVYSLTVNSEAADNWENEFNNRRASPDTIELDTPVNGALQYRNDLDIFKLTLEEKAKFCIEFSHKPMDNNKGYWRIILTNENNTTMMSMTAKGHKALSATPRITIPEGTYFITVSDSQKFSDMDYTLNLNTSVTAPYGDVNSDNKVDATDRITLSRHLAKWAGYETVNTQASDVNRDSLIDAKDRIILSRNLAKWAGYENLPIA